MPAHTVVGSSPVLSNSCGFQARRRRSWPNTLMPWPAWSKTWFIKAWASRARSARRPASASRPSSSSAIAPVTAVAVGKGPVCAHRRAANGSSAGTANSSAAGRSDSIIAIAPTASPTSTMPSEACKDGSASDAGSHAAAPQTTPCNKISRRTCCNRRCGLGGSRMPRCAWGHQARKAKLAASAPSQAGHSGGATAAAAAHTSSAATHALASAATGAVAAWARSRQLSTSA